MTDANGIEYELGDEVRYIGDNVSMLGMEGRVTHVGGADGNVGVWFGNGHLASQRHRFGAEKFVIVARFNRQRGEYTSLLRQ